MNHQHLSAGSGDGTVRLWDVEAGLLLDTVVVSEEDEEPEEAGEGEKEGEEASAEVGCEDAGDGDDKQKGGEEDEVHGGEQQDGVDQEGDEDGGEFESDRVAMKPKCAPVTCLASSKNGSVATCDSCKGYASLISSFCYRLLVAALIEGHDEVTLLILDPAAKKLSISPSQPNLSFSSSSEGLVRFPSLATFDHLDRLWVVGGAPLDSSRSMHLAVAVAKNTGGNHTMMSCSVCHQMPSMCGATGALQSEWPCAYCQVVISSPARWRQSLGLCCWP